MQEKSWEILIERYHSALAEYGLKCGTRLEIINRANVIIHRHINQAKEQLDGEIISDYFTELSERYYSEEITKKRWQAMRRETERFINFVQTGEVKRAVSLKGSRYELLPEFEQIASTFLESVEFHPNPRNDARWAVHKYFSWLAEQGYKDLHDVKAIQLQMFLVYCTENLALGSVHNIKLYLSKLYSFLYESKLSESSYQTLLSYTVNRGTKIQPTLQKDEISAMLDSIDRYTIRGKRAYGVMMLGVMLGLRACDIINLKLSDIDWINGEIKILQLKTSETVVLPLTQSLGEALKDYILNARPKTKSNHVFLKLNAPFESLKSAVTIGEIYYNCCKAAGLPASKRFHTLRRTLGTSMVTSGININTVAQVLGHTDVDSTKKYIALNSEHLKLCALPFDDITSTGGEVK